MQYTVFFFVNSVIVSVLHEDPQELIICTPVWSLWKIHIMWKRKTCILDELLFVPALA